MPRLLPPPRARAPAPPPPAGAPGPPAGATAAAAALFCEAAAQAGVACEVVEGGAKVGGQEVKLPVTVSSFNTLQPRSIGAGSGKQVVPGEAQLVASVDLQVGGRSLFKKDFTHAANDVELEVAREKVLDELLQRWMVGYVLAALDALGGAGAPALKGVGMEVAPAELEGATAWAAYPMVSGIGLDPSTGGKMGPNVGSMGRALGSYLEGLEDGLHSVRVEAKLGGTGGPGPCGIMPPVAAAPGSEVSIVRLDGAVEIDGAPADICPLSEEVSWPLPQGKAQITWEQFFVLRVAAPAEE